MCFVCVDWNWCHDDISSLLCYFSFFFMPFSPIVIKAKHQGKLLCWKSSKNFVLLTMHLQWQVKNNKKGHTSLTLIWKNLNAHQNLCSECPTCERYLLQLFPGPPVLNVVTIHHSGPCPTSMESKHLGMHPIALVLLKG